MLLSHRARDVFASASLNHLLTAAVAYVYSHRGSKPQNSPYFFLLKADLALASNNSRNCSFVLVYWIIDNKEFWWRGNRRPTEVNAVALNRAMLMQISAKPLMYS